MRTKVKRNNKKHIFSKKSKSLKIKKNKTNMQHYRCFIQSWLNTF